MKTRVPVTSLLLTSLALAPACSRTDERTVDVDDATATESATPASLGEELLGSRWVVLSVDGRALSSARGDVDIHFPEPGRIAGQGPCNRYMASYDEPDGEFRIGQAAGTMMACEEQAMDDERDFLGLLGVIERAWLDGDRLQLVAGDGRQIYAERR